ncbi:MAG: hypothetical protein HYU27_07615, partial [Acidobacteria bacterium]|nr:hypothetical protein [Acidobacteriota bacterium]
MELGIEGFTGVERRIWGNFAPVQIISATQAEATDSTELYSDKKCKGFLLYEIFNLNDLSISGNRHENIEFVKKTIRNSQFSLNNFNSGNYILRGQIKCKDMGDVSTAKFNVKPKQILNTAKKIETLQNTTQIVSSEVP